MRVARSRQPGPDFGGDPSEAAVLGTIERGPGTDREIMIVTAKTPGRRRSIRREVSGRLWASVNGIPTPAVLDHDRSGRWLLTERAAAQPGQVPIPLVLELARRIADAPAPRLEDPATSWRRPILFKPLSLATVAAVGIDPRAFVRARESALALPSDATSHGDFHPGNVLMAHSGPVVIDWEHVGRGYRHTDALRYLATQPVEAAAPWIRAIAAEESTAGQQQVSVCARWMVLRTLTGRADALLRWPAISRLRALRADKAEWDRFFGDLTGDVP